MGKPISKNSKMECGRHGTQPPTFVCHHLQFGIGLGFNQSKEAPDPDYPFEQAWCDECHTVFLKEGSEWNDVSEGFAKVMAICAGCFAEIRERNNNTS
jgi:hypothetical protein